MSEEKRYDNKGFQQEQQHQPPAYPQQQYPQQPGQPPAVAYGGNYTGTTQGGVVIVSQPQPGMHGGARPANSGEANSALIVAIVSIVCCGNWIFGLVAIYFWYVADQALRVGDVVTMQKNKKISLILSIIGIVIDVIIIIIIIILYAVVFATHYSNAVSLNFNSG